MFSKSKIISFDPGACRYSTTAENVSITVAPGTAPGFHNGVCIGNGQTDQLKLSAKARTLNCMHDQQALLIKGENMDDTEYLVRRLTPTECARLQGFPDWWCSDVEHTDSAEYKMWGNGVALPCVLYVMEGIKKYLEAGI